MKKHFEHSGVFHKTQGKDCNGEYFSNDHKEFAELCKNCNETLSKHCPTNKGLLGDLTECYCK